MSRHLVGYVALSAASLVLGAVVGATWVRSTDDVARAEDTTEGTTGAAEAGKADDKADATKTDAKNKRRAAAPKRPATTEEASGDSSGGEADAGGDEPKADVAGVYTCNICGTTAKFRRFAGRRSVVCPVCKSKERHRLLMHYLEHGTPWFAEKLDVLHFSPEDAEENVLRKVKNWHYVTADYLHKEELRLDLTAIDQPDNSWDVVIVYHILEHIVEDKKAMSEMFRVLRPGGRAVLQVPLEHGRTVLYEDASITDPKQRAKHFGQKDHVRRYSFDGFKQRLEEVGFEVEPVDYAAKLEPEIVEKHRLAGAWRKPQDEHIWVAHKPGKKKGKKKKKA